VRAIHGVSIYSVSNLLLYVPKHIWN
jgi:hypothetical protein